MRVLWFTNTPSNYLQGTNAYNGGGWISSLESELSKQKDVSLGIAFLLNGQAGKVERDGVCYYPISNRFQGLSGKIRGMFLTEDKRNGFYMHEYLKIISDFKPDIINIFGTEKNYGLIAKYTKIPIVIHIQGLLIPYFTAYFPPGYNLISYVCNALNPWKIVKRWHSYDTFRKNAEREKEIFKYNSHFVGRTKWDERLTSIYSPQATYDYCSEILRNAFYEAAERNIPKRLIIMTTISDPLYKGFDVVLKCASLMKCQMGMDFEWKVYGNIQPRFIEEVEGIKSGEVGVRLMGVASPEEIKKSILNSSVYVHPSYIDNSPNSVCEAQMMGCTVIGQFVGGMPSLIKQGETGVLVPANDPYQMACAIRYIYLNPERNIEIARKAAADAHQRHDKSQIVSDLMKIYKKYSNKNEFFSKDFPSIPKGKDDIL